MEKNKKYTNKELLKAFIPYYKNYKLIFALDMTATIFTIVSELSLPVIIREITYKATRDVTGLTLKYILFLAVIYLALKGVEVFAMYYMQKQGHIMGAMIERDMRRNIYIHLQSLSDDFYNNTKIGQLMARITTDLFDVTEFAHHCPEEFLLAFVKTLSIFVILLNINMGLTLIMFAMLPLMFILTKRVRSKIRTAHKKQRHQIGEINANIEDSLLGIKVTKSFANEDEEIRKFGKNNRKFLDLKVLFYSSLAQFMAITRLLDALMYITVIILGGRLLIRGIINPGDFVMYIMYATSLLATVSRLVNFTETFERGMTGIERYVELLEVDPKITDRPKAISLDTFEGNIKFKKVSFSYGDYLDGDKNKIIDSLDLEIGAGKKVAIVGPSGGGKTTLTNLIPRFYDINSGQILIDGHDIRDIKIKSLRNNIGIVQQDVYLFSGSIFENIAYGKTGADLDEVRKAAEMAGALDFILDLPNGFDTYVGERGIKLSGGQKQRISIARVFLKNPPILILDEATSALDNESEKIVQESLEKLSAGRTTVTIAHRLSTVINSDEIFLLTEDGIVEKGSHRELIARKGAYYNLYKLSLEEI